MYSPAEIISTYILGSTDAEHERLNHQGRLVAGITRHLLADACLEPGMHVLDAGSGTGDLALLVARQVGAGGHVTCLDIDARALDTARLRAVAAGLSNLSFHTGDLLAWQPPARFDAAVGRCVLLHQADPCAALASIVRHVKPGGLVIFQEPWFSRAFSWPPAPLFDQVNRWLHATLAAGGFDMDIGLRLYSMFVSAGLPPPKLAFEMLVDGNPQSDIYEYTAGTLRSLLPRMELSGIVTPGSIEVGTLADRLRREAAATGSIVGVMPLMGAWSRKAS